MPLGVDLLDARLPREMLLDRNSVDSGALPRIPACDDVANHCTLQKKRAPSSVSPCGSVEKSAEQRRGCRRQRYAPNVYRNTNDESLCRAPDRAVAMRWAVLVCLHVYQATTAEAGLQACPLLSLHPFFIHLLGRTCPSFYGDAKFHGRPPTPPWLTARSLSLSLHLHCPVYPRPHTILRG